MTVKEKAKKIISFFEQLEEINTSEIKTQKDEIAFLQATLINLKSSVPLLRMATKIELHFIYKGNRLVIINKCL